MNTRASSRPDQLTPRENFIIRVAGDVLKWSIARPALPYSSSPAAKDRFGIAGISTQMQSMAEIQYLLRAVGTNSRP